MMFQLSDGLRVERLDDEFMVLQPGRDEVLHLKGTDAEAFALAQCGTDEIPEHLLSAMAGLVELGLVVTEIWNRRRVLQLGGIAAAGAVAVVALPSVAAAGSSPGTTIDRNTKPTEPERPTTTFSKGTTPKPTEPPEPTTTFSKGTTPKPTEPPKPTTTFPKGTIPKD